MFVSAAWTHAAQNITKAACPATRPESPDRKSGFGLTALGIFDRQHSGQLAE
jgi:hypothetical protein